MLPSPSCRRLGGLHNKGSAAPQALKRVFTFPPYGSSLRSVLGMSDTRTRSLLLLDADPGERRQVTAIAGRAGWSVLGASCTESAVGLLQGPHGRDVQAALLGS